jgi:hypothetical protein
VKLVLNPFGACFGSVRWGTIVMEVNRSIAVSFGHSLKNFILAEQISVPFRSETIINEHVSRRITEADSSRISRLIRRFVQCINQAGPMNDSYRHIIQIKICRSESDHWGNSFLR